MHAVNQLNIPIVISNGMSTFEEIVTPLQYFNNITTILHCNSSYPSNPEHLDLNAIKTFKVMYPNLKIGYSGHEIGYFPTTIAVAAGAEVIERHFTLDHTMEGTDQKASLEPNEFKEMVDDIHRTMIVLGNSYPSIYPEEETVKKKLRK
jgi:sialic acid synthase SpsE